MRASRRDRRKRLLAASAAGGLVCMVAAAYVLHGQADVKTAATAEAKLKQKETAPEPAAKPVEPKVEPEISITFSGDTMFDWQLRPVVEKYGADYPFQYVKPEIEKADYSFVNLESVFTTKTEKVPGQLFWIKSDPAALQAIRNTGYDMVSIGNNHTLDYGTAGLLDTIAGVEAMGLPYVGAGRNDKEAYTAKEVTIKGKKFKFLGFVRFMPDGGWVAGENRPGVAGAYDLDKVVSTIREQKGDADYLIVYIHWGVEKTNQPAAYQKQYTEKMVEAGANAIVGSHPHWLQGFEYYNGVPVAYSLGNFLFPAYVKGHAAETGVLTLKCKGPDISMSFEPYTIRNNQIQPLQGAEKTQMYQYLQSISYDIEFDAAGNMVDKRKH